MTKKENMINVLNGIVGGEIPITPHWWGLYKFQLFGLINGYDGEALAWQQTPEKLFEIDDYFIQKFNPDMIHLTTAPNQNKIDENKVKEINKLSKTEDLLNNKSLIDEYMSLIWETEEDVLNSKVFDHVKLCNNKYGNEKFIALNEGSDVAWFFDTHAGFENGLISIMEEPENVQYFLEKLYARTFERLKALKKCGADGYINSETYCSSDIISPQTYRDIIMPIQQDFYKKVNDLGLITIVYFTGDIHKIINDITNLNAKALMVESSKKTFVNEIYDLVRKIDGKMALFGNLDSHLCLEKGTPLEIAKVKHKQIEDAKGFPFIMANDCPISFNTPTENIESLMRG